MISRPLFAFQSAVWVHLNARLGQHKEQVPTSSRIAGRFASLFGVGSDGMLFHPIQIGDLRDVRPARQRLIRGSAQHVGGSAPFLGSLPN